MTNSLYNDPKDRHHCNELNGSFGFFQCFDSDMEPVATHIHALTTTRSVGRYSNKREGRMQTRWDSCKNLTCVEINNSYHTIPHNALLTRRQYLCSPTSSSEASCEQTHPLFSWTKSQLELCGFRWSKQLRQAYGCLTPISSPKLCLCGR